ncbi:hydroxyphenylacetyl-CoA thioesterase PaaI [Solicola gregarius]|uniref:Hydroxyphenylacetyl-CoA thioesterase PaaI n=1 Tax=Solicola gregarius TaxID=2908642 RepID=A0AA46TGB5_9ACTN|nr:hydroxyphenylacetyl-CoA thioesterase PaaI [Solicola gregarius]UYM04735.1 hydroxyphenylacetyl-CoA thioesterase PaaI [Solicola gregarius]
MPETDRDELARRCAEEMWSSDRASQHLGMRILEVSAGRAVLSMAITDVMVNGHDICHGGYIATLADSAFAFACNSYDEVTVASGFDIAFLTPAHLGDELCAVAAERTRAGRSGIYDVTVWRGQPDDGERVAELRGRSRSLGRPLLR